MLVTNFKVGWSQLEHTQLRVRISNLEVPTLTYAVDFVIEAVGGTRRELPLIAFPSLMDGTVGSFAALLDMPSWSDSPWRSSGKLWVKSVRFSVPSGATRSVTLHPWDTRPGRLPGAWFEEGYAILRLPSRRDPRNFLRRLPQLDRPARALLAAEAVLRQIEWPRLGDRIQGYTSPRGLLDTGSFEPIYGPATRPQTEIVHPLALGPGRAEIALEPEGTDKLERIEVERTGAALVDRLERGEAVLGAEGFDATDRLAAFLDEIATLGEDANALGAMNAFLAQQGSAIQLTAPADPNVPRRRRRQR